MSPALRTIVVGDRPEAWSRAGFTVQPTSIVRCGPISFRLDGDHGRRGAIALEFDGLDDDGSIDGLLALAARNDGQPAAEDGQGAGEDGQGAGEHPNTVTGLDHLVVRSPDLDRTVAALRLHGFEPRRTRDVPRSDPPMRQVFFWAGDTIIELVGPATATGNGPATIWGLAFSCADIDQAKRELGDHLKGPKSAVQAGRRIATIDTKALDISVTMALMTPHQRAAEG